MMLTRERLLLLFALLVVGLVAAVPSPGHTNNNKCPTFFGGGTASVPKHATTTTTKAASAAFTTTTTSVRGGGSNGGVLEPDTLEQVESILIRAGAERQLTVIDFTATWCGPCKMIAPLFQELSEAMPNVVFVKVDVDENPDTAAKYSVSAMPTFVFIKGGTVVDRLMGANPARLQELIDQHK